MTLRRVGPDYPHWPAVLRLIRAEFAYMDGRIDPPSSMHRLTVADMAESARTGAVFVVEDAGASIACLFCKVQGDALYLGRLAVAAAHRGSGLARALVAAAEAEARARGLGTLELQIRIELTENHAAFARLGFAKTGETAHDGYDRPTSLTMRKAL
jgi:GNAT superfamily N-acetyltransferase